EASFQLRRNGLAWQLASETDRRLITRQVSLAGRTAAQMLFDPLTVLRGKLVRDKIYQQLHQLTASHQAANLQRKSALPKLKIGQSNLAQSRKEAKKTLRGFAPLRERCNWDVKFRVFISPPLQSAPPGHRA